MIKTIMHCDDKRTLYVLKEELEKRWIELKSKDFEDIELLKKLNSEISDYLECKKFNNQ